jgi:exodeoxyribonuclease VII small subunit
MRSRSKTKKSNSLRSETIESRLRRLDKIVEQLGEGEADLYRAKSLYEEGMALVKECRTELNNSRGIVEKLNRATGRLELLEKEGAE